MKLLGTGLLMGLAAMILLAPNAQARKNDLPPSIEAQIINRLEDMGTDSWNEGDLDVKFNAVVYAKANQTVYVIYQTRKLTDKNKLPWNERQVCAVPNMKSLDDIWEVAPNGYADMSLPLAEAVLNCIE